MTGGCLTHTRSNNLNSWRRTYFQFMWQNGKSSSAATARNQRGQFLGGKSRRQGNLTSCCWGSLSKRWNSFIRNVELQWIQWCNPGEWFSISYLHSTRLWYNPLEGYEYHCAQVNLFGDVEFSFTLREANCCADALGHHTLSELKVGCSLSFSILSSHFQVGLATACNAVFFPYLLLFFWL